MKFGIVKIRENWKCRKCNARIAKGSYVLTHKYSWNKICLKCSKDYIDDWVMRYNRSITKAINEVDEVQKLKKKIIEDDKMTTHNMLRELAKDE